MQYTREPSWRLAMWSCKVRRQGVEGEQAEGMGKNVESEQAGGISVEGHKQPAVGGFRNHAVSMGAALAM